MRGIHPILLVFLALTAILTFAEAKFGDYSDIESIGSARRQKLISVFNIVQFPNGPCPATGNRNGTCYTDQECADRNGVNSGSCAEGYGVCCVFTLGCGSMTKENCTYFESSGFNGGTCRASICMTNNDICQLRLDFNTFVITGPTTSSSTQEKVLFREPSADGTAIVESTQCNTDTFSVTNPGGQNPPVICGTNSGEHMYVEASDACNDLVFQMTSPALDSAMPEGAAATAATRMWSIKVTQIGCQDENKAPTGCTQYYYGASTGTVMSFNFEGGVHLANQNQNICVRRERGNCRMCWSAAAETDVVLSATKATGKTKSKCCSYGKDGKNKTGYDCLIIPGAMTMKNTKDMVTFKQCGKSKGLVSKDGGTSVTVCTDRVPFTLRFMTDEYEHADEGKTPQKGFKVSYFQTSAGC